MTPIEASPLRSVVMTLAKAMAFPCARTNPIHCRSKKRGSKAATENPFLSPVRASSHSVEIASSASISRAQAPGGIISKVRPSRSPRFSP